MTDIEKCSWALIKLRLKSIEIAPGTFRPPSEEERRQMVLEILTKYWPRRE